MIEDTVMTAITNLPNFAVALLVLRWQHTALEKLLDSQNAVLDKLLELQEIARESKDPA